MVEPMVGQIIRKLQLYNGQKVVIERLINSVVAVVRRIGTIEEVEVPHFSQKVRSPTLEALPHLVLTLALASARKRQCVVKVSQDIIINETWEKEPINWRIFSAN